MTNYKKELEQRNEETEARDKEKKSENNHFFPQEVYKAGA